MSSVEVAHYFVWQPRLEKKDTVGVMVRAGSEKRAPGGASEFASAVLHAAKVVASPMYLVAHPMFTSYFRGDEMEECWLVNMLADGPIHFSGERVVQRPIEIAPSHFGKDRDFAPLTVIADFERRSSAMACKKALVASEEANPGHSYNRLDLRSLPSGGYQLRAEIAEVTAEQISCFSERYAETADICMRIGGRTQAVPE